MDIQAVNALIDPLRQGFQADGADIAVDEATDRSVTLRLVVTEHTCLDCISPKALLDRILEAAIRKDFPQLEHFRLIDPRE
jgi:hypothetical protein